MFLSPIYMVYFSNLFPLFFFKFKNNLTFFNCYILVPPSPSCSNCSNTQGLSVFGLHFSNSSAIDLNGMDGTHLPLQLTFSFLSHLPTSLFIIAHYAQKRTNLIWCSSKTINHSPPPKSHDLFL